MIKITFDNPIDNEVWHGCYDAGWKGLISDLAFVHPAKFSRALIQRIYELALYRGWVKAGDTVIDPFGGGGLGALDAMANGLNWYGCELEQKFVDLGAGCDCTGMSKADWIRFYGRWGQANHKAGRHWCPDCLAQAGQVIDRQPLSLFTPEPSLSYERDSGLIPERPPHRYNGNLALFQKYARGGAVARLVQGDSRELCKVLGVGKAVMKSPPYATGDSASAQSITQRNDKSAKWIKTNCGSAANQGYGNSEGQLSTMPPGDPAAVITSPPFAGNSGGRGEASRNGIDSALFDRHSGGMVGGMGDRPDNLGNLPMAGFDGAVGSPPYVNSVNQSDGANDTERRIERMRKAGIDVDNRANIGGNNGVARQDQAYGKTDGQLGAMAEGDPAAAIGSPPFAASVGSDDPDKRGGLFRDPKRRNDTNLTGSYGTTPGQLGAMAEGEKSVYFGPLYDMGRGYTDEPTAAISSPPFENFTASDNGFKPPHTRADFGRNEHGATAVQMANKDGYGTSPGQLGADSGETFWSAARLIVEQVYQVLRPGGVTIWVCKDYVKNGQRVEFCAQWRALCEAVGFVHLETHRAMLVKERGVQMTIDGGAVELKTERKSFFRRLAEKNGSPRIDWEEVICLRKPL